MDDTSEDFGSKYSENRPPVHSYGASNENCIDIHSCIYWKSLAKILTDYNQQEQEHAIKDDIKTVDIMNLYLHLLNKHNEDQDREFMTKQLRPCCVTKCRMFRRNYRNHTTEAIDPNQNEDDIVYFETMDQIHCYVQHCYDCGYRLHTTEQLDIEKHIDIKQNEDVDAYDLDSIRNPQITKTIQLIQSKRRTIESIKGFDSQRMSRKYHQLSNDNECKEMYNFGHPFVYGYDGEDAESSERNTDSNPPINVFKKYDDLKQEITTNKIHLWEFNILHKKSQALFGSNYRKETFSHSKKFCTQHILAVMLYCNKDVLQYNFSKTYRTDNGKNHDEYYWMARYIKQAVHTWGLSFPTDKTIKTFYHGMNDKLTFTSFLNSDSRSSDIRIHSPLSTSSEQSVAFAFTYNLGLIIEFRGSYGFYNRCLSVAWISKYPDESEYLFIQNNEGLAMDNIIDTNGAEYRNILKALQNIEYVTAGDFDCIENKIERKWAHSILQHQIAPRIKFKHVYTKRMCDSYFENRREIDMSYGEFKENDNVLFEMLFHKKYEWIKLEVVRKLFPNLVVILLDDIQLCEETLNDILEHICKDTTCNVLAVKLSVLNKVELKSLSMQYASKFEATDYIYKSSNAYAELVIYKRGCVKSLDKYLIRGTRFLQL